MTISAHKLGPGSLNIGETGTLQEFAAQCTQVKVTPSVNEEDSVPVLSGEELDGDDTIDYELSGTLFQSYDKEGIIYWSHTNRLKVLPFTFIPSTGDSEFSVKGMCKIVPLEIGGEVKKRNTSDFTFKVIGEVTLPDAPVGG